MQTTQYNIGDRVVIVDESEFSMEDSRFPGWVPEMRRWCGEVMTIAEITDRYRYYKMAEDPRWSWGNYMIAGLEEQEESLFESATGEELISLLS